MDAQATGIDDSGVADLTRDLIEVAQRVRARTAEVLVDMGLTESQSHLLWALDPEGEPRTMRALARALTCDPSNITVLSDALQSAGLVERRSHPTDGRARVLVLTRDGRDARARLLALLEATSPLGVLAPAQQQALGGALAAILDATPTLEGRR